MIFGSRPRPITNASIKTKNSATGPKRSSRNHRLRGGSGERAAASVAVAAGIFGIAMSLDSRIDLGRAAFHDLIDR